MALGVTFVFQETRALLEPALLNTADRFTCPAATNTLVFLIIRFQTRDSQGFRSVPTDFTRYFRCSLVF